MRVLGRVVPAVLTAVVVASCSGGEPPVWTPRPAPPEQSVEVFGRAVASADYAKLQTAEQVRSIDPCALLEPDQQLSRYGPIVSVSPWQGLAECVVRIAIPGNRVAADVTVDLDDSGPLSDEGAVVVAGETVHVDKVRTRGSSCGYRVPMRFPSSTAPVTDPATTVVPEVVELPPVPYLRVSTDYFPSSTGGACQVAGEVVGRIVAAFAQDRVPRRAQAVTRIGLAERSPCELLERFPDRYRPERFDVTTAPYECKFWAGDDIVGFSFAASAARSAMTPILDYHLETIQGYQVLAEDKVDVVGDRRCLFHFPVGASVDGNRVGADSSAHIQPRATLSGICEVTRAVLPAALELVGANR
ncbi:hypothetical protein [Nocardia takedensis]|uniref:hypothetical protein n=1 Tax=Nocardia takedensis TaxID=259390 RepID=UPI0002F4A054|nr:hypothetical protein [Nocardia takedensis]